MSFELEVLYEDNHIVVVNKPTGVLVQGDNTGDETLIDEVKSYLRLKYNKPRDAFVGLVHRIDRVTSGIVIFAKTSKALGRLNKMFQLRQITKTYWVVVIELPENVEGELIHYLLKDQKLNKSKAFDKNKKYSKRAQLSYKLLASINNYHLLEVKPITGRHHQIRVQLAKVGSPIKGDVKYGFSRANVNRGIHLHAQSISFIHPVKKEKLQISSYPNNDDKVWKLLVDVVRV